jgi:aryl carrier-like protein
MLDKLPLTPNGKLDRKALPAPDLTAFATPTFEPPQGETETLIATIWQDLLGIERVGRHDNFFNLGGHSLLAISLIERLRHEGQHSDVRALFSTSDLAQFASALEEMEIRL